MLARRGSQEGQRSRSRSRWSTVNGGGFLEYDLSVLAV